MASQPRQKNVSKKARGLYHDVVLRFVKLINVLLTTLPFACCWMLYYAKNVAVAVTPLRTACMIVLFALLYIGFGRIYDSFLVSFHRISEMLRSQFMGILMTDCVLFLVLWLMSRGFPNLLPALCALAFQAFFSLLWCKLARSWYLRFFPAQKTALVYAHGRKMADLFRQYELNEKFEVLRVCTTEEFIAGCPDCLADLDTVFLCGVSSHERNHILKYCVDRDVGAYIIPRTGDLLMRSATRVHLFHLPMLLVERYNPAPEFLIIKRVFDVIFSAAMIVVTSPLMLLVAVAIKLQDGGPVFYRQTRLTKDGREFQILKFRSMRVDAEKDGVARLSAGESDDRITPVGRLIRSCRLDELPQLFNILAGTMSVVGPRPERPEIAAQYEKEMPEFRLRLQAKAGLTGYAQVYGKYNSTPYDKLQMDLMYIARPSLIEDWKLIFATLKILFERESAEGIAEGSITAMDVCETHDR